MEETEINKILEEYVLYINKEEEAASLLSPEEEVDKFYLTVEKHISKTIKETDKIKSDISGLFSIEKVSELYSFLKGFPNEVINNLSIKYNPISLKEQRLQIMDKYPSFKELSFKVANNGFKFSCSFKLIYKDFAKSDRKSVV